MLSDKDFNVKLPADHVEVELTTIYIYIIVIIIELYSMVYSKEVSERTRDYGKVGKEGIGN